MQKTPFILFIFSLCLLSFFYGVASSVFNFFPYEILKDSYKELKTISLFFKPHHLSPIRFQQSGVHIHDIKKVMPGTTLLTSYWPETNWSAGIRLINIEGKILHHWEIRANDIWPQSPHDDYAKNSKNANSNYVHGTYLFPNGDILFNIEYLGLVRMNAQGKILWKLPFRTHHSIFRSSDGNFWVSGLKWIGSKDERSKNFKDLIPPFAEEIILNVSPNGAIIKEISLLESLYFSDYKYLFWHYNQRTGDLLHLNDIDILDIKHSEPASLFQAGDILVSMREINTISVLNSNGKIKWLCSGIFTRQHDPDFEDNGWLTVFDNRYSQLGGSKIRAIHPEKNLTKDIYPIRSDQSFFTLTGGKHQKLSNGNRLITEARAGRILEISPDGEIVWEWIQKPYDNKLVPEVLEGTRYSITEKDISLWKVY